MFSIVAFAYDTLDFQKIVNATFVILLIIKATPGVFR